MKELRSCVRTVTCIEGHCFSQAYDACKYLMELACERRRISIRKHTDASQCFFP
ncbi:hypothetical protein DESUT3_19830 [Desulfuromonas versatilis]|uniref:Uncharacterized protein n=1 Tax=Desulfuromonas versatilis TaxID=2802975 RepID=A0ABN6DZH2_9BACT|nr:hypothetical protein [Desulfuromonas versatilis]BCR04914.1 hypothetical protein DESUT3_19830 [Desulfuromonas versatilis]